MMKRIVSAASAAAVLSLSIAAAQTGAQNQTQTTTQGNRNTGASAQQDTTVVGCVARGAGAAQSATFMLNNVQMGTGATASAGVSGSTSARSGASTSGTTGTTTTGTAGSSTSMPTSYTLVAGANQNLANYVGQRVEIRGHVVSNAAESNRNTTPGNTQRAGESTSPAAGTSNERSANNTSRFQVTSVRPVGGTCQ